MNDDKTTGSTLYRQYINTPTGKLIAIASTKGLCFLEFQKPDRNDLMEKRLEKFFRGCRIIDETNDILEKTGEWLTAYFNKDFEQLTAPPLDLRGSEFELTVWRALEKIPPGHTSSYGDIAKQIGKPNASRAVGNTNRRNPVPIIIPCHRVIGQDKSLTGYGGGLDKKEWLLAHETAAGGQQGRLFD